MLLCAAAWCGLWCSAAAQPVATGESEPVVSIAVGPEGVGLGGQYRPGDWTALSVDLANHAGRPLGVICEWVLQDADGDPLHMRRAATLDPSRPGRMWLYAPVPLTSGLRPRWRVNVLGTMDEEANALLATRLLEPRPESYLSPRAGLVVLTGSSRLGLEAYATAHTQQEPVNLVNDVDPADLPDRWYGLTSAQALIWTPDSRDFDDAAVGYATVAAVRHWVMRGGHLVVVLPAAGERWTRGPLAALLPSVTLRPVDDVGWPTWLGGPSRVTTGEARIAALSLELVEAEVGRHPAQPPAAVLLRDVEGRPLVVGASAGMGRVTLIGLDLTHPALRRMGLPRGPGLWSVVFGWRSPAWEAPRIEAELAARRLSSPQGRAGYEQSRFIAVLTARRSTAGGIIGVSIVGLTVYWLVAGPLGFMVLRRRGQTHLAWMVFAAVVLVFSVTAWGAALLLRPTRGSIEHMTVMDVDVTTGLARVRGWASLLVPRHRTAALELGSTGEANNEMAASRRMDPRVGPDVLASAAFEDRLESGGFVVPVSYEADAADPLRSEGDAAPLRVPMRATTRTLAFDAMRRTQGMVDVYATGLPLGQVTVTSEAGSARVQGDVRHGLPGPLRNVLIVYCPGDRGMPRVTQQAIWEAGQPLGLDGLNQPGQWLELLAAPEVMSPAERAAGALMKPWRGYLGRLMRSADADAPQAGAPPGAVGDEIFTLTEDQTVRMIQRLSFYAMLPPPLWDRVQMFGSAESWHAERALGRGLDLTDHLAQRRLIVIGHLPDSSPPLSWRVDGREVPGHGWTVVRWMTPVRGARDGGSN